MLDSTSSKINHLFRLITIFFNINLTEMLQNSPKSSKWILCESPFNHNWLLLFADWTGISCCLIPTNNLSGFCAPLLPLMNVIWLLFFIERSIYVRILSFQVNFNIFTNIILHVSVGFRIIQFWFHEFNFAFIEWKKCERRKAVNSLDKGITCF